MMGRAAWMAVLGVILAARPASADWGYTRWGMSPDEVAQASDGAVMVLPLNKRKQHPAPFSSETAARGTFADGALRLGVSFSFDLRTKGLTCVFFTVSGQDDLFRESFVRRLGAPQATGEYPDAGMKTFTWTKQDEVGVTLMNGQSFATQCKPGTIPPLE